MKGSKGFTNKAKSGAKATTARWRQAAAKAEAGRQPKGSRKPPRARGRGKK